MVPVAISSPKARGEALEEAEAELEDVEVEDLPMGPEEAPGMAMAWWGRESGGSLLWGFHQHSDFVQVGVMGAEF